MGRDINDLENDFALFMLIFIVFFIWFSGWEIIRRVWDITPDTPNFIDNIEGYVGIGICAFFCIKGFVTKRIIWSILMCLGALLSYYSSSIVNLQNGSDDSIGRIIVYIFLIAIGVSIFIFSLIKLYYKNL